MGQLLTLDKDSSTRLRDLDGRALQLDLEGLAITLSFIFVDEKVRVRLEYPEKPDTTISGSPAALFAMAAPSQSQRWGMPGSAVTISGNAALARDLERLFSRLDPDWEGRLASLFGDVWGYQIASGLRGGSEQARAAAETGSEMLRDYIGNTTGLLVPREEFRTFADSVDAARDAVDRLEAKVRIAAAQPGGVES